MIKNLVFDWGGVILTLDKEKCLKAFDTVAGVPNFGEYLTPYLQKGFFAAYENGDIGDNEFCDNVRAISTKADVTDDDIVSALDAFLIEIPEYKANLIKELSKRYNIYVLSNNNPICWRISKRMFEEVAGVATEELFTHCYLSFELNRSKPGAEIFRKVIEESGMVPEESLFIDDAVANIEAAAKEGFRTLFYDVNKNLADELERVLRGE